MNKLLLLFAIVLGPVVARAQVPVTPEVPLVNQYIQDSYLDRTNAWWNALGRQLTLMVDVPAGEVDERSLQNIIFFATNHKARVNLNEAAPRLLNIYSNHPDTRYRMLALAGLHAIGDTDSLKKAFRIARRQDSERIRKMARAALADLYRRERQ